MRRWVFFALLTPAVCGLLWAVSCEKDNYRDELPLRSYDAAPQDLVRPPLDLTPMPDQRAPGDLSAPTDLGAGDMATGDMTAAPDLAGRDLS